LAVALAVGLMAGAVANAKSESAATPSVLRSAPSAIRYVCPVPTRYRAAFRTAAQDTHLPMALILAVGRVESNLDHGARSEAGALGLLQLMPLTAAELHLDPTRPRSNVLAGARYLKEMITRFGSTDLGLAAYNAGPAAVERAGGAPATETLSYVANVNRLWQSLQGCT
jgi:soluble lytic murein transglycosylase-like protein